LRLEHLKPYGRSSVIDFPAHKIPREKTFTKTFKKHFTIKTQNTGSSQSEKRLEMEFKPSIKSASRTVRQMPCRQYAAGWACCQWSVSSTVWPVACLYMLAGRRRTSNSKHTRPFTSDGLVKLLQQRITVSQVDFYATSGFNV